MPPKKNKSDFPDPIPGMPLRVFLGMDVGWESGPFPVLEIFAWARDPDNVDAVKAWMVHSMDRIKEACRLNKVRLSGSKPEL
eukprot:1256858-Prymnesium_polylepis.1